MEFSELFTQCARDVLPHARKKGLVLDVDCHGPRLELGDPGPFLRAGLYRVLLGIVDCFDAGWCVFSAEVTEPVDGRSRLVVHAAGAGDSRASEVLGVLQRLQLIDETEAAQGLPAEVFGDCPATGGAVQFVDAGPEGLVLSLSGEVAAEALPDGPVPEAAGALAWLVSPQPGALDAVGLRLRALGWQVQDFDHLSAAAAATADTAAGQPPQLLIVAEDRGDELAWLGQVAQALPGVWTVLAVVAGSPALRSRRDSPVDIRVLPLSPQELVRFTVHVDPRSTTVLSRLSSPAPAYSHESRRVLVVDDNEVNQIIARGQLEALGYEVVVAADGLEALDSCCDAPPDMVLMDVDMPVMDGLEASEHLRTLQRTGSLPPFPIVASTAADSPLRRDACAQAGMDGFLSKPMDVQALADELHRLLPARPATAEL